MIPALLVAVQTLTKIPVPSPAEAPSRSVWAWSAVFYPAVGLLLGGVGIAIYTVLSPWLPRSFVLLVVLAVWAWLTGALHEDGLADTFDALGSQTSREEIFRVLKDSRTGSYGVVAVTLVTLFRWQGLEWLPEEVIHFGLLASQVLARSGLVMLAYWGGPAGSGSGKSFAGSLSVAPAVAALLLGTAIAAAAGGGQEALVLAGVCVVIAGLLSIYFRRKIGGVTGDCLGAGEQLQEIGVLAGLLVLAQG